jgi:hypothetical protein
MLGFYPLGGAPLGASVPVSAAPAVPTQAWIKVDGIWHEATVWLNIDGVWKVATSYVKVGTWR